MKENDDFPIYEFRKGYDRKRELPKKINPIHTYVIRRGTSPYIVLLFIPITYLFLKIIETLI